ncbi:hypothetical protein ACFUIY_08660 [Streptomyces griseorubiginosus]|uniref:hypothetical protein n=1 Tax=Streptomyces griseorubiginosus TaxID=67304 RepID=UPI00362591C8
MTIAEHTELTGRIADDFTALQEAVLARMNGICAPEVAVALEPPSLAGPIAIAIAIAHADVLARGAVRRAELSTQSPERLRRPSPGRRRRGSGARSGPGPAPCRPLPESIPLHALTALDEGNCLRGDFNWLFDQARSEITGRCENI